MRFSEEEFILEDHLVVVCLERGGGGDESGGGVTTRPSERAMRGMLHADDAGVLSKSADRLARMMTTILEGLGQFGLTVLEEDRESTLSIRVINGEKPKRRTII